MIKYRFSADHTEDADIARVVPVEAVSVTVTVFGSVDFSVAVLSYVILQTRHF
jgi:hypothetical protein